MNLHQLFLTKNACYLRGRTIVPRGVMVHSTGANNPYLKRYVGPNDGFLGENKSGNHWNTLTPGGRKVCVHGFIGKLADGTIASYQTLPWNYRGWHSGNDSSTGGNSTHISFEICEDGLNDPTYFEQVYQEAVELTAYLCKMYHLNPMADGVVICHSEGYKRGIATNHGDVMHWFPKHGKNMDDFRAAVDAAMTTGKAPVETEKKMNGKEIIETLTSEQCYSILVEAQTFAKSQAVPDWATDELAKAVELGITDGENPMQLIPRYQAAIMAKRAVVKRD